MKAAERVAQLLRRRIALGGFPPGTKLPSEREIAGSLGVSRNTMREAIRSLVKEGIVETTLGRGGGTRVVDFGEAIGVGERNEAAEEFVNFIRDRMEYRLLLEPAAASFAAQRGSEKERRELVVLLAREVPDLVAYHQADTDFHLAVAHASHNPVLREAIVTARTDLFVGGNALWLHVDWHLLYGETAPLGEVFRTEHSGIAAAIMAGDPEAAGRFMRTHLEESIEQFMRLIEDSSGRN